MVDSEAHPGLGRREGSVWLLLFFLEALSPVQPAGLAVCVDPASSGSFTRQQSLPVSCSSWDIKQICAQ